ncbi:hypothetical protein B0H13DRAFT_1887153 [Mycena leptocephala]|nr:hypothetical protein B0H13DRAFT_1887153 [Mycena leptocephala]
MPKTSGNAQAALYQTIMSGRTKRSSRQTLDRAKHDSTSFKSKLPRSPATKNALSPTRVPTLVASASLHDTNESTNSTAETIPTDFSDIGTCPSFLLRMTLTAFRKDDLFDLDSLITFAAFENCEKLSVDTFSKKLNVTCCIWSSPPFARHVVVGILHTRQRSDFMLQVALECVRIILKYLYWINVRKACHSLASAHSTLGLTSCFSTVILPTGAGGRI